MIQSKKLIVLVSTLMMTAVMGSCTREKERFFDYESQSPD